MNATTPLPWTSTSATSLSKPLVDHRIYTIALRKMPEFLDVFNRLAMPILMKTLAHPVGFYTSMVGPQNQFIHMWAYEDLADYERRSRQRDSHPDFPAYLSASAHLIVAQETRLIRATAMPGWAA
ncbi:NIPSNAP family protein [Hydrogenophaga sp.]|uniref:NIPSNAP family protein n=1 Tax=Hydrogenophaga sp. TaxID=1904254 RepID=UPI00262B4748|nr:NIPSNAP family protein [Hydrogenophaga sp.]MCW5654649.1 NIPSNAP family protein [Hydrogenophaga sp.]